MHIYIKFKITRKLEDSPVNIHKPVTKVFHISHIRIWSKNGGNALSSACLLTSTLSRADSSISRGKPHERPIWHS